MKLKKLCFLFLLCTLLLGLCACAQSPAVSEVTPIPATPQTPAPTQTSVQLYTVWKDGAPYDSLPQLPENPQILLAQGSKGICLEQSGDFIKLQFSDGTQVWVHSWYLTADDMSVQQAKETAWLEARTSSPNYSPVEEFWEQEDHLFTCMAGSGLNCRSTPSSDGLILTTIPFGTQVTILGRDSGFYLCSLPGGGDPVYCSASYLSSGDSYVELDDAVDLRVYLPTLEFEMLFASENNITGEAMYPAIPLLETKTAQMLARAQEIFRTNGYTIKLYDAYRPKSAQYKLYDIVQNSWFIANPYTGNSWHQLGRAVDISLIDMETGEELEMPTPMHTFTTDACRFNSSGWTAEARENVNYMTDVMTYVGFGTITTEWWHFEYTAQGNYMDPDMDYSTLTYRPLSDLIQ